MHQRFCGIYVILGLDLPAHRQVLYFRSDWIEHPRFIIALAGNEQTGKEVLFKKLTTQEGSARPPRTRGMSHLHGDFLHNSRCYKAVSLPGILTFSSPPEEVNCTTLYPCSGKPNTILVTGYVFHLEVLLGLLKEIPSLGPVRNPSIFVVLYISRCEEARRQDIHTDFSLPHDVLQIPIVPLHGYDEGQMDDLKAALRYAFQPYHKYDFLCDCLDFSPCYLAHECIMTEMKPSHGMQWSVRPETGRTRKICEVPLLLFLFGLAACLSTRLADCLWPLFFEIKTILWVWAKWFGLPT